MTTDQLEQWRRLLENYLARLGRDDIGVGEVVESGPNELQIEFIKGGMRRTATLPADTLGDFDRAREALNIALLRISKAVERQHITAAKESN
jgi:hypothetical protein